MGQLCHHPAMRVILLCLALLAGPVAAQDVQLRCGWLSNPTPANYFLEDAVGDWTLSIQGRGEAPGFYDADAASGGRGEWVLVSPAGYGYGCACVLGVFGSPRTGEVRRVDEVRYLPLQQCATDPALPERSLVSPLQD